MQNQHRTEQLGTIDSSQLTRVAGGIAYPGPRPPNPGLAPVHKAPPAHPAAPRPQPCGYPGYGFGGYRFPAYGFGGYSVPAYRFGGYGFGGYGFPGYGFFR
jgi:hypothetical protein